MNKKQFDRRPDEKPAEQGTGTQHDPTRPAPERKAPDLPEKDKASTRSGKHPEGHPINEPTPKPGTRFGGKEILEGERSDRESGRPVQLDDDDDVKTPKPGRADAEPGLGGRQQEGRQDRKSPESKPIKR